MRIIFDDNLQVTSVASFIRYLNSLSFAFTLPYWVYFELMPNRFPERVYNTFTAVCNKPRIASFMINEIIPHPSPQPHQHNLDLLRNSFDVWSLDLHHMFVLHSNLLQSSCSFPWSMANKTTTSCIVFLFIFLISFYPIYFY